MNRLLTALAIVVVLGIAAFGQSTTMPPPAGTTVMLCTYQASTQALSSGFPAFLQCDANGNLVVSSSPTGVQQVVGNVAAGSADSGNPVKTGCPYNSTLPTYSTGQRGDCQINTSGEIRALMVGRNSTPADGANNAVIQPIRSATDTTTSALNTFGGVFNGGTWDRQRGDTNGTWMVAKASSSIGVAQVTVGTASTQIAAARAGRTAIEVCNLGTTDVYLGNTGVTSPTGTILVGTKGACKSIPTNAAVFGATGVAGSQAVSYMETF